MKTRGLFVRGNFGKFASGEGRLDHAGMTAKLYHFDDKLIQLPDAEMQKAFDDANNLWCDVIEARAKDLHDLDITSVEIREAIDKYTHVLQSVMIDQAESHTLFHIQGAISHLITGRMQRLQSVLEDID